MARPYTRTILFSETFDFPTPPSWNRQSLLRAESPASLLTSSSGWSSPFSEPDPNLASTSTLPSTITTVAEEPEDHSMAMTRWRSSPPPRPPRSPSTFNFSHLLLDKPLPDFPPMGHVLPLLPVTWDHTNGAVPDCPCCVSASMSRWSICSDDSTVSPPSPSTAIQQRLKKMTSASTLRSVRSSVRSRLKAGLLQLTRRGSM